MTRKDYKLIAKVLDERRILASYRQEPYRSNMEESVRCVALDFAEVLKQENPRFKTDVFLKACGF